MSGAQEQLCCPAVVCFVFLTPHSGNSHLVGLRTIVPSGEGQGQATWDRKRRGEGLRMGHWGQRSGSHETSLNASSGCYPELLLGWGVGRRSDSYDTSLWAAGCIALTWATASESARQMGRREGNRHLMSN